MIQEFRKLDKKIAVVAVDPSSPVSGGAILGDRIRMQKHATDENVFIRSMASRGEKGGLSRAAKDAVIVLDTMGYEIIIIETVGAGQGEFEIANLAHSTGIVTIPGAGDGMQAVKAGILEKGDIFIVNKSDKPDADQALHQLNMMLEMRHSSRTDSETITETSWAPKVLKTSAQNGNGVKEVVDTFLSHFDFMKKSNTFDKKKDEMEILYFNALLKDLTLERILKSIKTSDSYVETLTKIQHRKIDPLTAAELLTDKLIEQ
jgi:LAO/AO transport system kinase